MRKFRGMVILFFAFMPAILFCGCGDDVSSDIEPTVMSEVVSTQSTDAYDFDIITPQEAKDIIDSGEKCIVLDVRTAEEFNEGHIENAMNIDHEEIAQKAEDMLQNKDELILVYCRSGRRSKIAAQALTDMGYKYVKEFGGIIDWPYEIVK